MHRQGQIPEPGLIVTTPSRQNGGEMIFFSDCSAFKLKASGLGGFTVKKPVPVQPPKSLFATDFANCHRLIQFFDSRFRESG
jgi:hypothetical protein